MLIDALITAVQIIAESVPISSSGHVLLFSSLFHTFLAEAWIHFIHLPSIIIASSWLAWYGRPWQHYICAKSIWFLLLIGWADFLTALLYLIKKYYLISMPLWIGFAITSGLLWSLRYIPTCSTRRSLSFFDATIFGFVQGVALLPGISRLAAVFVTATILRFVPLDALAITWLLALPIMSAALLKGAWELATGSGDYFSYAMMQSIVLASCIATAAFAMNITLINKKKLWWFAVYLLIPLLIALYYHI